MVTIEPDRVVGQATHPWHRVLRVWTGVTLLVMVATVLTLPRVEPAPEDAGFSAAACALPDPRATGTVACLEVLPAPLDRLPSPGQFEAGRLSDLVAKLRLDIAPRQWLSPWNQPTWVTYTVRTGRTTRSPAPPRRIVTSGQVIDQVDALVGPQVSRTLDSALRQLGPLAAEEYWTRAYDGADVRPAPSRTDALATIAAERDWTAVESPVPPAPPGPGAEVLEDHGQAKAVATAARARLLWSHIPEALEPVVDHYAQKRRDAFEAAWGAREAELTAIYETLSAEHLAAAGRHATQLWLAALALGAFLVFSVMAWRTRPRRVGVTAHAIQLGQRSIRWERVTAVDWRSARSWVRTADGARHDLGPLQLSVDLRVALEEASVHARDRVRTLQPLDTAALSQARRLLR